MQLKWAEHDAVIKNGSWGNDKKYADNNFCTDIETEYGLNVTWIIILYSLNVLQPSPNI